MIGMGDAQPEFKGPGVGSDVLDNTSSLLSPLSSPVLGGSKRVFYGLSLKMAEPVTDREARYGCSSLRNGLLASCFHCRKGVELNIVVCHVFSGRS